MTRVGSDESGFSVETGASGVHVRAWGFWDAPVAARFVTSVLDELRATGNRELLVDATRLKPQRVEGQAALRDLIERIEKLGVPRAEFIVSNAITKMQLARIVRDLGSRLWTLTTPMSSAPVNGEG